mgnify:CR=1 FL=1
MSPAAYHKALRESGGDRALAGDILRRRAVDRLLDLAVAVDADGQQIEFPVPEAGEPASAPAEEAGEPGRQDGPSEPPEVES